MKDVMNPRIIILGAGLGGIGTAIKLQWSGFTNLKIIERGPSVGGTWWFNRYPGLAVDIASPLYSYEFEPNPNWSREFAPREELQQYAQHCANKYDVMKYVQFHSELEKAVFNERTNEWELYLKDGRKEVCDIFVSSPGPLVEAKYPDIKGIDTFKGEKLHSARWDESYDFKNKNVAIIGIGASAVQIIPSLAPLVKQLTIFQRRAPWILPKNDFVHGPVRKTIYRYLPFTQKLRRAYIWYYLSFYLLLAALKIGPIGRLLNKHLMRGIYSYRDKIIKDPEVRKKVTPNYDFGCKRMCWTDDYYPALTRKNVDLITDPINQITEKGVLTETGKLYEADALVFATGYDVGGHNFEYVGRSGITMSEYFEMKQGMNAYKSSVVTNFPNLFLIFGPRGQAGVDTLGCIQLTQDHAVKAIKYMRDNKIIIFEVKESVSDTYNNKMNLRTSPFVPFFKSCNSYYINRYGQAGSFAGSIFEFKKLLSEINPDDYVITKES
jgi:cation diffusion facilitator CzcD-associated flavoprotein CzcO